ncbi:hypothetical protein HDV06_000753 [Boothiomyces sp. JEL0866]|nr:hypothetical protein HDV06_000753 [Boothiomyces sp. JEL0866]
MSDSSTSSTAELSNAIKELNSKQTFQFLADHFQTKVLIRKSYQYPRELPVNFTTNVIKWTPLPLDFILSVASIKGQLLPVVERNFYKSFKDVINILQNNQCPNFIFNTKFKYYKSGKQFWKKQKDSNYQFRLTYLSLLRNPESSPWLAIYLKDFELEICVSNSMDQLRLEDVLSSLNRLKSINAMFEYSQIVNYYDLYEHVPLQSLYNEMTIKNQLQTLEELLGETKLTHYMDYLENILEYSIKANTVVKNSHFINGGKIVSRLSPAFSVDKYPAIYISNTSRQIRWYAHNFKSLVNTAGNPKYDFDDICESYLDVIEDFLNKTPNTDNSLSPRKVLLRLLVDNFFEQGLETFAERICQRFPGCNLKLETKDFGMAGLVDSSIDFYNIQGNVNMIDSTNYRDFINAIPNIKLVSVDCEWNTSDLSITQIGAEFNDNSRQNYILDMLTLQPKEILEIFKLLWTKPVVDLKKINMKAKVGYPSNLTDLFQFSPTDFGLEAHETKKGLDTWTSIVLGKQLDKRPRMSFWEKRPLRKSQILYAVRAFDRK